MPELTLHVPLGTEGRSRALNRGTTTFLPNRPQTQNLASSKHFPKQKILFLPEKFYFSRKMAPKFEKWRKMAYSKSRKIGLPGQKIKI